MLDGILNQCFEQVFLSDERLFENGLRLYAHSYEIHAQSSSATELLLDVVAVTFVVAAAIAAVAASTAVAALVLQAFTYVAEHDKVILARI